MTALRSKLMLWIAVKVLCAQDLPICSVTRSPFLSVLHIHRPSFISSSGLHSFFQARLCTHYPNYLEKLSCPRPIIFIHHVMV